MDDLTTVPWLTAAQRDAIRAFACRHGSNWKAALRGAWNDPAMPEGPVLRGLRDSHGEPWLSVTSVSMRSRAVH
ncbi:MAG: hypothetical protein CFE29_03750 [Bradyrhizobiaceae bacterium PARB1]|jgi:hypothetical protein|nr:MAG: hypothetical protein CFE29_03750 [Bradyrhizobiaceae bacterium PARB1]